MLLTRGFIEHDCVMLPWSLLSHALLLRPSLLYYSGKHRPFHRRSRTVVVHLCPQRVGAHRLHRENKTHHVSFQSRKTYHSLSTMYALRQTQQENYCHDINQYGYRQITLVNTTLKGTFGPGIPFFPTPPLLPGTP